MSGFATRRGQGRQDFSTLFAMKEEIRGAVKARPGSFDFLRMRARA